MTFVEKMQVQENPTGLTADAPSLSLLALGECKTINLINCEIILCRTEVHNKKVVS